MASLGFQHRSAPIYRIEAIRSELAAHLGIFRSTNKALDQIEGQLPPLIAGHVGLGYRHHSAHHQGEVDIVCGLTGENSYSLDRRIFGSGKCRTWD